jgi:hypothetical protein
MDQFDKKMEKLLTNKFYFVSVYGGGLAFNSYYGWIMGSKASPIVIPWLKGSLLQYRTVGPVRRLWKF